MPYAFSAAYVVKGFKHLGAPVLDHYPAVLGGRRVVFLASDDDSAATTVAALAEMLGFAPIKLGALASCLLNLSPRHCAIHALRIIRWQWRHAIFPRSADG